MEASMSRAFHDMSLSLSRLPHSACASLHPRAMPLRCLRSQSPVVVQQSSNFLSACPSVGDAPGPGSGRHCRQVWACATAVADAPRDQAAVMDRPAAAEMGSSTLELEFDNSSPDHTVLTVAGPATDDMLRKVTNALNVLDRRVLHAKSLGDSGGVWRGRFTIQNDQDAQVPENEHYGLRNALLQELGIATGESILPNIHDEPIEFVDVSRMSLEVADGLSRACTAMAEVAARVSQLAHKADAFKKAGKDPSELESEAEQATRDFARFYERAQAAVAALSRPKQISEPSAAKGPGGELMAEETGKRKVATGPAAGDGYEIFLQGFNWESCKKDWYKVLLSQIQQMKEAGFTAVWLPPPSDSVSPQGYLPRDLYVFDSQYGSASDLKELLRALEDAGIKSIADVVINHRCAHKQDNEGRWNVFGGKLQWKAWAICSNNPDYGGEGAPKRGDDYTAAPNIDHTNPEVKKDLTEWLRHLINFGFKGWRLDYVKGYSGEFVKDYIQNCSPPPELAFGEFWDTCSYTDGVLSYNQDAHRQRIVDWVDQTGGTAAAFDFTTKGILQEAVQRREYWRLVDPQGKPPGMMGMWPSRAVTFIENHDTGSTLNHWPFPANGLFEGYAYILTHPGTPCVFYDHFFGNQALQEAITALLDVRRRLRISARSEVRVQTAESEVYAAIIGEMVGEVEEYRSKTFIPKIVMKVGPGDWSPSKHQNWEYGGLATPAKSWAIACSGPNFAVWEAVLTG